MREIIQRKRLNLIYPVLIAIYPALALYVFNMDQLRFRELAGALAVIVLLVLLIWFVFHRLTNNIHKSALLTGLFCVLFFSYGHVRNSASFVASQLGLLDQADYLLRGDFSDTLWLALWAAFLLFALWVVFKYPKDLRFASKYLNVVAVIAVTLVVGNLIRNTLRRPAGQIENFVAEWKTASAQAGHPASQAAPGNLPDIYYIILDGFGRQDILEQYYQADLSGFYSYLDQAGFYIASQSQSNYAWTELSLASSLNFMYLDDLGQWGAEVSDTLPLEIMVEQNRLFAILRSYGYQVVTFADEYDLTDISSADEYLSPQAWVFSGYQSELLGITPLPDLARIVTGRSLFDLHRDHLRFMLGNLYRRPDPARPQLVFAHLMAPHPPFVFSANGEPAPQDRRFTFNYVDKVLVGAERDRFIQGYRDQAAYLTTSLIPELEKILRQEGRPAIVIIQGDHGPGLQLDWNNLENTDIRERMSILNAYYFYDQNYERLSPDMTPVNTFRLLLTQYFGLDYPLLENKAYYTYVYKPYDFIDVTDLLQAQYPGGSQ